MNLLAHSLSICEKAGQHTVPNSIPRRLYFRSWRPPILRLVRKFVLKVGVVILDDVVLDGWCCLERQH